MVYRPMIGFTLPDAENFPTIGMIDSGCDMTMMDAEYAELLRIDRNTCEKILVGGVVGSQVEAFIGTVTLAIEQFEEYPFELDVCFVPNMPFGALFGHSDFFEKFEIRFHKKERRFYLRKED